MAMRIDINSDLGEAFGAWKQGDDASLLRVVSSANIACGFHAGDPRVMLRTVELCAEHGVAVGAHPGFPDLVGFGRRVMQSTPEEIRTDTMYQIGALQAICRAVGVPLHHVKPHGALYNLAAIDYVIAVAICEGVSAVMDAPFVYAQPQSELARAAGKHGIRVAHEAFADRAYLTHGQLAPRSMSGSVLSNPEEIANRALQMVRGETIMSIDGDELLLECDTLCVHGDSPAAVVIAETLTQSLKSAGFTVSPP